jgi:hypothetical protein
MNWSNTQPGCFDVKTIVQGAFRRVAETDFEQEEDAEAEQSHSGAAHGPERLVRPELQFVFFFTFCGSVLHPTVWRKTHFSRTLASPLCGFFSHFFFIGFTETAYHTRLPMRTE